MTRGRKDVYTTRIKPKLKLITEMSAKGIYEKEMARAVGVSVDSWFKFKKEKPEFMDAVLSGRCVLITELKSSLYDKARGFTKEEKKVIVEDQPDGSQKRRIEKVERYFPPDTGALIFALTNLTQRQDDMFYNRQDVEHSGAVDVNIVIGDEETDD